MRLRHFALLLVVGFLGWARTAPAQVAQGELRGTVLDESGAPLPGATLTATHTETGLTRVTTSSAGGGYLMPALRVGRYQIKVEIDGFATYVQENVRLAVGESATFNFTMKVASRAETITVSGDSLAIDTEKSELAGRIAAEQIESLPLNGRNWLDLVALVPGTRGNPGTVQAGAAGGDAARYQMDGISVTGQGTGGETQSYSQAIVGEFQVLTNRYDAEYGRVTGAVINAVTKSGTNAFHGSAFGYLRDDVLDSESFFTGKVAPFNDRQLGGTLGGPIVKGKAHFFASYEYQKRSVTALPATGFPSLNVDVDAPIKRNLFTLRTDVQINSQHRAFARGSAFYWLATNQQVGDRNAQSAGWAEDFDNLDLALGETWVVNSRAVNEVRAGVFYFNKQLIENAQMPRHTFPSTIIGPATNAPQWWREKIFQLSDSLSFFVPNWHGEHKLKVGLQFQLPFYQGELPKVSYGNYTFSTDPRDINDPRTYPPPTSFSQSLGDFHYDVDNPIYAGFVQDDWSINSKLTINLGLRYDVEPNMTNSDFADPLDPGPRRTDSDNVAPRLGFAYDVRGNGRTVVRGGAGRYYGNVLLNIPMNEQRDRNVAVAVTVNNPVYGNPLGGRTLNDYVSQNLPRNRTLLATDYETPVQEQYTIGIAQRVGERYGFQMDYVHIDGRHLQMSRNINLFEDTATHLPKNPTVFGRPYPQYLNITRYESTGKSQYDGLQVGFDRRGDRFRYQGSYTLSWTKGHTAANRFGTVSNPFNLDDEYSVLTSDQRHRFIVNTGVRLPWDLQTSAIFFAGSPTPLNITTTLDPFRSGTGRWLDANGNVLPKNGERRSKSDYKLDLRLSKNIKAGSRAGIEFVLDVFNVFNTYNYGSYGTVYGSATYLKPVATTNLFYRSRQFQFGLR